MECAAPVDARASSSNAGFIMLSISAEAALDKAHLKITDKAHQQIKSMAK